MAPRKSPPRRNAPRPAGLKDPARDAALRLLVELESRMIPAGGRIEQLEGSFQKPEDRRLFRSLVSENLRHRLRIDAVLDRLMEHRTLADVPPWIRAALRLGATQILLLQRIPPHAAVHSTVELAGRHGHRGTTGLVNAVLRKLVDEGPRLWEAVWTEGANDPHHLSIRYSHPEWLVRRWLGRWGAERTAKVLAWNQEHPDYWIRLRPGESPPPRSTPGWIPLTARLSSESKSGDAETLASGEWSIQDGSAILVGFLPPAVRGLALDLCAAPGTKTGHLRERSESDARIVALDLSPGRLRRMRRGFEKQAALIAGLLTEEAPPAVPAASHLVAADGRRLPVREPWDGVLIDAPCSNLGVLRRRVDLKWRAREEEIERLAAVQRDLLESGARGVAPGGWLVYSVCTLEPEETTEQRDAFLAAHPGWAAIPLPEFIPAEARGREGELVLLPGELETDGTYAFVLRRESFSES